MGLSGSLLHCTALHGMETTSCYPPVRRPHQSSPQSRFPAFYSMQSDLPTHQCVFIAAGGPCSERSVWLKSGMCGGVQKISVRQERLPVRLHSTTHKFGLSSCACAQGTVLAAACSPPTHHPIIKAVLSLQRLRNFWGSCGCLHTGASSSLTWDCTDRLH